MVPTPGTDTGVSSRDHGTDTFDRGPRNAAFQDIPTIAVDVENYLGHHPGSSWPSSEAIVAVVPDHRSYTAALVAPLATAGGKVSAGRPRRRAGDAVCRRYPATGTLIDPWSADPTTTAAGAVRRCCRAVADRVWRVPCTAVRTDTAAVRVCHVVVAEE